MMELPNREFIKGEALKHFLHGAEIVLTKKRMKKIALARLSIKRDVHGRETIVSLWGRPGRAPAGTFTQGPVMSSKFTSENWLQMGKIIGAEMENWVDNDGEFDRAEGKAHGLQFNIWETTEHWDRTHDLLDVLEKDFGQHIGGKLHWRVRTALCELIEMMLVDVNTAIAEHLASPDGRDALVAIAGQAGLELAVRKMSGLKPVAEAV